MSGFNQFTLHLVKYFFIGGLDKSLIYAIKFLLLLYIFRFYFILLNSLWNHNWFIFVFWSTSKWMLANPRWLSAIMVPSLCILTFDQIVNVNLLLLVKISRLFKHSCTVFYIWWWLVQLTYSCPASNMRLIFLVDQIWTLTLSAKLVGLKKLLLT